MQIKVFMKKNYFKLISPFLLSLLIFTSCRKNEVYKLAYVEDHPNWGRNECRLVFGTNADPTGSADFTFQYNDKGLSNIWDIENYGTYTLEYDLYGRIKNAALTQGGEVTSTTDFLYEDGIRVSKEIGYGTSTDTSDIEYYHYDSRGNLVKVQSFLNDYIATGKYDPDGDLLQTDLFFSGVPVYTAIYTYNKHLKNPYLAVPGIDHLFPYYTPMDLFYGKWRWASLKQIAYDETGNPIAQFEYDPSKTVWQEGSHDYPTSVTYYDLLSGGSFPYPFEFDNCDGVHNGNGKSQITTSSVTSNKGKINLMTLLKHDPSKSMKEQVKEFREQLKNMVK